MTTAVGQEVAEGDLLKLMAALASAHRQYKMRFEEF
jgi:hypothetical protein